MAAKVYIHRVANLRNIASLSKLAEATWKCPDWLRLMAGRRFLMNAARTTKQGQQINVGKDHEEYQAIVSTITMHADDMKEVGLVSGGTARVRSENGEALFQCREGKVPQGIIFVPYGPPTCRLMGQTTDGTGMPTSKGWEVEVEPA
jgi:formylmethanofuran dehydrogenase subunit D